MMRKSVILAISALLSVSAAHAQTSPNFAGKTVTVLIGGEVGSGFDTWGRPFAQFLGAHLPGDPTVVVKNMPGGGGLVATNYIYNVAPRDGTELAVVGQVSAISQVLHRAGVHYDVRKLNWVGRLKSSTQVLQAWYTSGIKTIADAFTHQVVVGGTSAASSSVIFPHLMNDLLGTKFKVVSGYKGPASAILAMERGEVEAMVQPWSEIKANHADWLRKKKINLLVQFDRKPNPELANVPAVVDLAHNQQQRELLGLFASGSDVGYPVVAPPDLARPVVATLRKAFEAVMKDPKFLAYAKRERLALNPLSGAKLQKINDEALDVPKQIVAQAQTYIPRG